MSSKTAEAVKQLYKVFKRYRFTDMEGDPAFPGFCDPAPLLAEPLGVLPREAFETFAWKAVTTWGTADDLRHFLPRMLELLAEEGDAHPLETWALFGKIAYAKWRTWPKEEQSAIENYVEFRWFELLHQPVSIPKACGTLQPYLLPWSESGGFTSVDYIKAVVFLDETLTLRLLQQWSDWIEEGMELGPVVSLAETFLLADGIWGEEPSGVLLDWLRMPVRINQLFSAWTSQQDDPSISSYLSDGHAAAERWIARRLERPTNLS